MDFAAEGLWFDPWLGHGDHTIGQDTLHIQKYKLVSTLVGGVNIENPVQGEQYYTVI